MAGVTATAPAAGPREETLAHLRAVLAAGSSFVEPSRAPPGVRIIAGLRAGPIDRAVGAFVAERDFLVWLLQHNVSVCDLGAGTTALRYKGERHERPSMPCAHSDPGGLLSSTREGVRSHGVHSALPPAQNGTQQWGVMRTLPRGQRSHTHAHSPAHHRHQPPAALPRPAPQSQCTAGSSCCRRHPTVSSCVRGGVA